jgi:hypothetical protein
MSIEVYPGDRPLAPPPPPTWGDIAPVGKTATVLRVALPDRWVSFPFGQLTQWEHQVGEPELLTIQTAKRSIVVTGRDLADIRIALDLGRLSELRTNFPNKASPRPGPQVRRITVETITVESK